MMTYSLAFVMLQSCCFVLLGKIYNPFCSNRNNSVQIILITLHYLFFFLKERNDLKFGLYIFISL